jgi:hypothetical protein
METEDIAARRRVSRHVDQVDREAIVIERAP